MIITLRSSWLLKKQESSEMYREKYGEYEY